MSIDVRRQLGREVKQARLAARLTQADLADKMGVDRAYVSGLELGQRNPTIVTLWHVAQALGLSLGPFFREKRAYPERRPRRR